ncbi:MAG: M48 family metallopeptidase [Candidatus Marinimicrobia bacterium]|jgi:STE24 endopeptidase|nr:M48 family metallopeptidase [Candidatus Neomarinimicrobiota bacterium]MDP6167762.1 M48 family metallopeptidase [Candidatus Neomarinimicrobiota bacterium]MDP6400223.1 M48 family metallopeptidase [Candidatus Neomarinimicrobiota bacterium]MDP6613729.1 M48 family metallopeptidase [Candidatus Neomarinimicrobiota bacterium]MDP6820464.1 M48 family metallopeptidase [Candidatus Neomarinimicrobiota bacterium]|tara:strand:+ start:2545 stop:3780 length:1236 start_codon:yes stop_codon:yes gene_type:complete
MEQTYYLIIIFALAVEYLLSTVSSILDMGNIVEEVPADFQDVYDREKYARSQSYLRDRTRFGIFSSTFSLLLILVVIHTGLFGVLDQFVRVQTNQPILAGLLFFGIIFIIQDIISLPFSIYSTFVIEEKFEFNRTTPKTFVIDKLKGYALTVILGSAVIVPILFFFERFGPRGWWIAWALVTLFMIAVQPLFVHVIAPLFNKFTPLEEGELRTAIEEYSEKVKFPIGRIDVMDGSKRSGHSNAYFSGLGKSRRIALFDTLLEKHTTEEIISVVAHEVGHYKRKHIIKGTALGILETGVMLFIFNLIMKDAALFAVFGVSDISVYGGLVFFAMLYAPVSMITSLLTTAVSRKNEFEADTFSLETTKNPQALVNMLKGLAANNLAHLTPHPLKVFLSYSHPPVISRIAAVTQK